MVPNRRYATLLLITESQDTAAQFARLLPADRFAPEYNVCSAREAAYVLGESAYDVVVIDDQTVSADGSELASRAAEAGGTNVLLLADESRYEAVSQYGETHGFMTLQSPVNPSLLKQSLGMMATISGHMHELESLQAKMDEMRLVNRAKLILVQRFKMSEQDAHRFIEKNAMDRCVKRRTIAQSIIRTYQN
jgi:response regulator NasT